MHSRTLLVRLATRVLASAGMVALGCPGDDAGAAGTNTNTDTDPGSSTTGESTTTGASMSTGSSTTSGGTETETDGEFCDPPVTPSCNAPSYPIDPAGPPYDVVVDQEAEIPLGEYCCDGPFDYDPDREVGGVPVPGDADGVHIYRPDLSPRPLPTIIFAKAQDGALSNSETLFERLAANGYLVVALNTEGQSGPAKRNALTCATRWVRTSSVISDYGSCDVILMGASSGGYGAWEAGRLRNDYSAYWGDSSLRALVLIAAGTGATMNPYDVGDEVPLQAINGATDEEEYHALYWYDLMFTEPSAMADSAKSLIWAYRFEHFDWGGETGGVSTTVGELVGAYYINAFLNREVTGESSLEDWLALNGEAFGDEVLAPGGNTDLWQGHAAFTDYAGGTDCRMEGSGTCESTDGCFWVASETACVNHPLVFTATTPSRALGDVRRLVEDFENPGAVQLESDLPVAQYGVGAVVDLIDPFVDVVNDGNNNNYHGTGALLVEFDGNLDTGSVTIPIDPPVQTTNFTHLTLRAGNVINMTSTTFENCAAQAEHRVDLEVELVPATGARRQLDVETLVQQDYEATESSQIDRCNHQVMMQTRRFALDDFCSQGGFGGELEEVVIHFPTQPHASVESRVLIDSIEFTSTPEDVSDGAQCLLVSSSWDCEADQTLQATETSCADEPDPTCTTTQTSVALPTVPFVGGGTYEGWTVFVPWLEDPQNPTQADIDLIEGLCVQACEQQWSDNSAVSANCDDSGAFSTPTLREVDVLGPVRQIPLARRDGSGIFGTQSLSCDLTSDCSIAYDEWLAMAAPRRPTPAEAPLGVGQEYVVGIDQTQSQLVVDFNGQQDSVELHGSFGYSFCPDGSAVDPCPFYLGSLEVKSNGSIAIPVTCPWGTNNVTLYNIDIHLGQPAFGIAEGGTDMVGFPRGALVFDATFKQNAQTHEARGTNTVDVVIEAGSATVEALQIPIHGMVDVCGGTQSLPALGTFDVVLDLAGSTDDSPPSITIDIPSTVTCNSTVDLDATATDPDGDLASVRWYVDDQLISDSVTALRFSTGHEVRAVARDDRGAATTATKSISCTP